MESNYEILCLFKTTCVTVCYLASFVLKTHICLFSNTNCLFSLFIPAPAPSPLPQHVSELVNLQSSTNLHEDEPSNSLGVTLFKQMER